VTPGLPFFEKGLPFPVYPSREGIMIYTPEEHETVETTATDGKYQYVLVRNGKASWAILYFNSFYLARRWDCKQTYKSRKSALAGLKKLQTNGFFSI
jgi:hypothetical protein